MSVHHDRVEALARVLTLEAGPVHKQMYWVDGPPGPVCGTNRDLYTRLVAAGQDMNTAGRRLAEFLRAWWLVSRLVAVQARLELDTVAAMITAATTIAPPPRRPAWRTTSYGLAYEPASYADWEQVVLSQIADLADFADAGPLDPHAYFRPPGSVQATGIRWYYFDPQGYLECGMRGWDDADGLRAAVSGPVIAVTPEPEPGERPLNALFWADLAHLSICGQEYE